MSSLKITQKRSGIGGTNNQRQSLRSLGLHRIGDTSIMPDRPEIRGMVKIVFHLVDVEELVDAEVMANAEETQND
jgi:large subunit ribosomal protein L30